LSSWRHPYTSRSRINIRSREQWRHGSAEEEEKARVSGYYKEVQLRASGYSVVTQFAKKAAPSCFFSPCVVNNGAHA
jgi:hypothetical protein